MKSLREILDLDELAPLEAAAESAATCSGGGGEIPVPETATSSAQAASAARQEDRTPAPESEAAAHRSILLGWTNDRACSPVDLEPQFLSRHAAFLGSTGSGKTTAALNVIEQLLLQGVPALLVDRKGDVVTYALASTWAEPVADPTLADRQRR